MSICYVEDEPEQFANGAGAQKEHIGKENSGLLFPILKQIRPGMDLSKVTLPTFILEPRSFLDKLSDYYYHCDILSEAVSTSDPLERIITIVKWYLSGFYKKPRGAKKPYNPILGEYFRCYWYNPVSKSKTFFIAEQVSHHPPKSAFHVENKVDGYIVDGSLLTRSKYNGTSVSAILDGKAYLRLARFNETYVITMPYANCTGIYLGPLCMELGGKVKINCVETACKCELDFKLKSMLFGGADSYNAINGKIMIGDKQTHTIEGHWDRRIKLVDKSTGQSSVLWEVTEDAIARRLKRYTVCMDAQEPNESAKLWHQVTIALRNDDQQKATEEKTKLEEAQRKEARERAGSWEARYFVENRDTNEWRFKNESIFELEN